MWVGGSDGSVGKSAGINHLGQLVGNLSLKWLERVSRKTSRRTRVRVRTKTDTGRRGEYPQALERTVVKELGKLTP